MSDRKMERIAKGVSKVIVKEFKPSPQEAREFCDNFEFALLKILERDAKRRVQRNE